MTLCKQPCRCLRPSPLLIVFLVSIVSLCFGTIVATYDIDRFGAGLYLCLVSVVTIVVALAFCLVGTDEQTEPTVAKKVWSTTRQTIRRYARSKAEPSKIEIKIANIDLSDEEESEESHEMEEGKKGQRAVVIRENTESQGTDPSLPSTSGSTTIRPIPEMVEQIDETMDEPPDEQV